jgi:HTH-type transcriptional repressor of NAD biosynthesis genes
MVFNGYCSSKILKAAKHSKYDYYLLTDVDIPWQNDYLRDRPNDREKMLNVFKEVLDLYDFPYKLISGDVTTRIKTSVEIIDKLILKS